jgi:hypothetical protein
MFRKALPRVYELIDLIKDRSAPSACFQDFDNSLRLEPLKKQVWLAREAELDKLGEDAWDCLKKEARPYLASPDPKRGWEQLMSILNQARAYLYLQSIGCSTVRFIPRSKKQTPDLEGDLNGRTVLCEVKTINISDTEANARCSGAGRPITGSLKDGFFHKLRSDLEGAEAQTQSYTDGRNARRIVFVVVNFDDMLGEYKTEYYKQIDASLEQAPIRGKEIVFYNRRTAFHTPIAMNSATVLNE